MAKTGKKGEAWLSEFGLREGLNPLTSDVSGYVPSGISLLDANIGGGFPLGRTVELFGPESSGKTALTMQTVANCQQMGGTAVVLDSENTFHREFAGGFGVDVDRLVFLDPTLPLEMVFARINGISEALRKRIPDKPILFIWDTLNATHTKKELKNSEDGEYATTVGGHRAQIIRGMLRVTSNVISQSKVCLILVNHVYEAIGGMSYGPTKLTPGGMGPKYYASVRVYMRSGAKIKDGSGKDAEVIGHQVVLEVVKNKMGVPKRSLKTRFYYGIGNGYNDRWSIFDYLTKYNLIKRASSWYTIEPEKGSADGPVKFQSTDWLRVLDENPGLLERVRDKAIEHYGRSFR